MASEHLPKYFRNLCSLGRRFNDVHRNIGQIFLTNPKIKQPVCQTQLLNQGLDGIGGGHGDPLRIVSRV
jgi:hypothetical protein